MSQRKPNDLLRAARLARVSPSGSGRPLSRQEVGEAVAAEIFAASGGVVSIGPEYVARLERGEMRWPNAARRAAFRAFFGVDSDAALGFYITRPQPSTSGVGHEPDVEPAPDMSTDRISAARVDLGRELAALREAASMTQAALGQRLAYSVTTIASVETGQRDATRQFWERADRELNAGGVLLKAFDELDHLISLQREHERQPRHEHDSAPQGSRCGCGVAVGAWGWREVRALREALRLTVRSFAAYMGVANATVSSWERHERATRLHLATEEMLDRALTLADDDARTRFVQLAARHDGQRG